MTLLGAPLSVWLGVGIPFLLATLLPVCLAILLKRSRVNDV